MCWLTSSSARDARGLMLGKGRNQLQRLFFLAVLKQVGGARWPKLPRRFAGRWSAELAFGRDDSSGCHCITTPRLNRVTLP